MSSQVHESGPGGANEKHGTLNTVRDMPDTKLPGSNNNDEKNNTKVQDPTVSSIKNDKHDDGAASITQRKKPQTLQKNGVSSSSGVSSSTSTALNSQLNSQRGSTSTSSGVKSSNTEKYERDIFVASAAVGKLHSIRLPDPNTTGNIPTVPLESLHPSQKPVVEEERKINKYDTSIPRTEEAKLLEKFSELSKPGEDSVLLQFIKENESKPENSFPYNHVAAFNPKLSKNKGNPQDIRSYIDEYFYSDYYFNVSLVFITCVFAYTLAYWGFSIFSLLVVFLITGTLYQLEFKRYTRNIRDDIKRVHMHETLSDKTESVTWLNSFVSKFWMIYMPTLSQQVKDSVNPVLLDVTPGYGIDALSLDTFTLGTKAPTIDAIQTYTKKGKDIIEMDWKFSFTPNDTSNMTYSEVKAKINPKIALGVTIGKGLISKSLPILVEDINVSAHARVTVELGENFPNVKIVSISLLEPPFLGFALKPIGGDTFGLDIMTFLPGLKTFITNMINSNAGPILYAPNKLDINVEEIIENSVQDCLGVIALKINKVSDLKPFDQGVFSPFVSITTDNGSFNGTAEKYDTTILKNFSGTPKGEEKSTDQLNTTSKGDPSWATETHYILINSLEQKMTMTLLSKHLDSNKDHFIGKHVFNLTKLYEKQEINNAKEKLFKSGTESENEDPKGTIDYSITWYPVLDLHKDKAVSSYDAKNPKKSEMKEEVTTAENADEEDDSSFEGPGVLKLLLKSVDNLDTSRTPYGLLNPTAELYVDQKLQKSFRTLKRINEPSWEETVEALVSSKTESEIKLIIYDTQFNAREKLCEYVGTVADLQNVWDTDAFVFHANPYGKIKMTGSWKQLKMEDEITATKKSIGSTMYLGAVRVHLRDGRFHSEDLSGVGDVDPYVNICLGNVIKYRTNYYASNKKPIFNSVIYIPITSETQTIKLDVFDYQSVGDDRALGVCEFPVLPYMNKNDKTGEYHSYNGDDKVINGQLQNSATGAKKKSTINYSVSFVPIVSVYSPDEYAYVDSLKEKIKEADVQLEKEQAELKEKMKEHPEEYDYVDGTNLPGEEMRRKLSKKTEMSFSDIISRNDSGVLVFEIERASNFKPSTYLHVLFDDISYPSFISNRNYKGKYKHCLGSGFVRDLQNSKITFRSSRKAVVKSKDDIIEEYDMDVLDFLKSSYQNTTLIKFPKTGGRIEMKSFLYPTKEPLADSDKLTDTGILKLEILNAEDLISHDRNGKSDPFVKVKVDGATAFKSKVIKKNLNPTWNEKCNLLIPSRARSKFILEIYDWDRAGSNDLLCSVPFPAQNLSSNGESQDWRLPLQPKGTIFVKTEFTPEYCRPEQDVGEGGLAGMPLKMIGGAANLGAGAVGDVAGLGVSGITKGATFGSKLIKTLNPISKSSSKNASDEKINKNGSRERTPSSATKESSKKVDEERDHASNNLAKKSAEFDPSVPNQNYSPMTKHGHHANSSHLDTARKNDSIYTSNTGSNQNYNNMDDIKINTNNGLRNFNGDYQRNVSTQSNRSLTNASLSPKRQYPCHVQLIQAESVGTLVQIRCSVTSRGKLTQLHKTETRRADKEGVVYFGDSFDFNAPPEANLVFGAEKHQTFGKDLELGFAQLHLGDPQIQQEGQLLLRIGQGALIIKIQYGNHN